MKTIELTSNVIESFGNVIYVIKDHISAFHTNTSKGGSIIIAGGVRLLVQETPAQINTLLEKL